MKYLFSGDREYLFNLANDLGETRNLLTQQPEDAKALRSELEKWSKSLLPAGLRLPVRGTTTKFFDFYLDGKHELAGKAKSEGEGNGENPMRKNGRRKKKAAAEGDVPEE